MGNQIRDKFINSAVSQIGYKESGNNNTKYATYFDSTAWQFFNTKKQGTAWCSLFVHWNFCQVIGAEQTRKFFGEPVPKNNCAAGVPYFWNYLVALGWKVSSPTAGDIIFFENKGHVGIVEKVSGSTVYTIEGNKSNQVKRCSYTIGASKIYGYCRPNWAALPDPEPTPTPKEDTYEVKVRTIYYREGNIMTGEDVKSVQLIVGATPDKKAGPKTGAAIKAWQKKNGLSADGYFGPKCWEFSCGAKT